jgi:GNAT superfamily N-acetyltransferase
MSISLDDLEFVVLTPAHDHHISTFNCKNSELKSFLTEDAYKNQLNRISVTRLVFFHGRLVGYFTLVTDVIKKNELDDTDGEPGYKYQTYSALKIARLATHEEFERQGIGRFMLLKIFSIWIQFSRYIGCRIITVDAKPDAVGFYVNFSFHEAIIDQKKLKYRDSIPLYIDIHKELERIGKNVPLSDYDES